MKPIFKHTFKQSKKPCLKVIDKQIIGIDYGSKLAGTTCIAFQSKEKQIIVQQSLKKKDADQFILDFCGKQKNIIVMLDCPLSLPGVYTDSDNYDNYFYRKCDLDLKAMSPMFLGGLTARGMRLKSQLEKLNVEVFETYPSGLVNLWELKNYNYKEDKSAIPEFLEKLKAKYDFELREQLENWHQVDALLAFISGKRMLGGEGRIIGDEEEGLIYF